MDINNFKIDEKGVWFQPEPEEVNIPPAIWICSPLQIVGVTRDHYNENHGRLLQFFDSDKVLHEWAMPMELLAADGGEYRKILLSLGLQISHNRKAREYLTMYIQMSNPTQKIRCVNKTGWHENVYIFPNKTIPENLNEKIIFQSTNLNMNCYETAGTLEEWQKNVCNYAVDNSRLGFCISSSFAAPCLNILNEESGGIHLQGPSSCGKTTALKIAASIYGGKKMIHTWRATTNGLEGIATLHNDSILLLDELGQVSAQEIGEIAYMLANGSGKSRANVNGFARRKQDWRIIFLSSGEITLAEHLRQTGKKIRAGQEVRIVNIPAQTNQYGIFEYLHGFQNGDEFSRFLSKNSQTYFGTAGIEFIKLITSDIDYAKNRLKILQDKFYAENLPINADGQVLRVLQRFALIAAAGTLATEREITGWPEGEAFWSTSTCFNIWINSRGGTSAQEIRSALLQVRHFFEQHGNSRFSPWEGDANEKTINRAGYKRTVDQIPYFFVFPEVFKNNICEGLDFEAVTKILIDKKWLIPDSEGKSTRAENLPCSNKTSRCYRFDGEKIFSDEI